MNKVANKTVNFIDRLKYEIASGVFRVGDRLPSHRRLCDKYGISRTTVAAGLAELQTAGWLTASARSGCFVAEKAQDLIGAAQAGIKTLRVVFLMPPDQARNPLLQVIFTSFCRTVNATVHSSVLFTNFSEVRQFDRLEADCAVVFGCDNRRILHELARRVGRVVMLNIEDEEFEFIAPDNYRGGQLIASYLIEEHHTKVGCIRYREGNCNSDFSRRFLGLCRRFDEAGVGLVTAFLTLEHFYDVLAPCHLAVAELFEKEPDIRVIICPSDMAAVGVYDYCKANGIAIPSRLSVIGFDDQFFAPYLLPRLTTLRYPAEAIGIRLAESVCAHQPRLQEKILPVLIKRESVAHAST